MHAYIGFDRAPHPEGIEIYGKVVGGRALGVKLALKTPKASRFCGADGAFRGLEASDFAGTAVARCAITAVSICLHYMAKADLHASNTTWHQHTTAR